MRIPSPIPPTLGVSTDDLGGGENGIRYGSGGGVRRREINKTNCSPPPREYITTKGGGAKCFGGCGDGDRYDGGGDAYYNYIKHANGSIRAPHTHIHS